MRLVVCLSVLLFIPQTFAQEHETYAFYRNAEGEVSQFSKDQAKQMLKYAKEHGQITLWLVLNYPYNVDFENMTSEEINTQKAEVSQGFNELLEPLMSSGDVWHPLSGVYIRGPGCTVRANSKGLKQLLDDQRLFQITTYD
jgi:hypothetical protein